MKWNHTASRKGVISRRPDWANPFCCTRSRRLHWTARGQANPVRALISPTTRWHFPVLLGTEARALLVVDRDGEGWKAVSLGYANLTGELNLIWKQWPASRGYHPQVVAMFRAKQHLFSVPENNNVNLTPIEAVPMQARSPKADTSQSGDRLRYSVLGHIAEAVQQLRSATRGQGWAKPSQPIKRKAAI